MRFTITTTLLLLLLQSLAVTPRWIPREFDLVVRDDVNSESLIESLVLEKRRGGGGSSGGGRGGSGGGSGGRSGSGGRGGSSSSGRDGSSGGSNRGGGSSSSSRTSSSNNRGGSTRSGSGPRPVYGGGYYYAGGARTPYTAGSRSPTGLAPTILPAAALGFGAFWLYSVYSYPYTHPYHYVDQSTNQNETLPVVCVCQEYSVCGCDDNNNSTFYDSIFNGTQPTNSSVVKVVNVNGTETIYINGTLPNGTTAADPSISSSLALSMRHSIGYWPMVAIVSGAVWLL